MSKLCHFPDLSRPAETDRQNSPVVRKPHGSAVGAGLAQLNWVAELVEAAGVEPASANPPLAVLHV